MFIDVNGINANYTVAGKAESPALLLLHGWGCNAGVYDGVVDVLAKYYRVYLPELPGFGESAQPPQPWGVDDYAEFTLAFCRLAGINPAAVFAHSLGCRISIKLLSRGNCPMDFNPKKIIFTGAAGIRPKHGLKSKAGTCMYKLARAFMSLAIMKKLFPDAVENMRGRRGSQDYRAASPVMRGCLVKIVNEDLKPLLPKIKQELLLIWGAGDCSTPLCDGKTMEELIPRAGLAVIENAGHYAFLEQPALFGRILDSYLGDLKSG